MRLLFRFLRTYAVPFWPWYLLGFLALYGTNQLTVLVPRFLKESLDALAAGDRAGSMARVWLIAGSAVGIVLIRTLSRVCFFNPGRAAEFRLKNHLFRHLIQLPQSFHDSSRVGDLMSRATNDLQNVRALIGFGGLQLIEAAFVIPLTLHQMTLLDPRLTWVSGILMGMAMLILWQSAQRVVKLVRKNLEELSQLSDHILDTYSAIPVVQGFCAQPAFMQRFGALNDRYVANGLRIAAIRAFLIPLVTLIGSLAMAIVLWWGGQAVIRGDLSVGSIAAFSGYITILVARMMSFGWTLSVIQRGMVALRRIYDLMDVQPDLPPVRASMPAQRPAPASRSGTPGSLQGGDGYRLEVRDLTFTYPGSADRGPSLIGVDFTLEPGQTLGIFGHTGSGKTTLVHLLARVYTPPPGTIRLNGIDVRDLPLDGLRDLIALVPQDPFLFSTSIRENILFGSGGGASGAGASGGEASGATAEGDEARLRRAVELACLGGDLQMLANGLETVVGARGITLSGGQRQRVALARAFARSFRILLLDDVLAAVDHQTERRLIQSIYSVAGGGGEGAGGGGEGAGVEGKGEGVEGEGPNPARAQTTVIVSHRVSALQHCDLILVLEEGRVIDRGSHTELVARPGVYADTWRSQQESSEREVASG